MNKSDTLFMGFILFLLVTISHYNFVAGSVYAVFFTLFNLLDAKKRK